MALAADFSSPTLSLSRIGMDPALCAELCGVLTNNEIVSTVDFSRNNLGDEGAEHIARLLAANKGIISVNLAHNGVTDAGAIVIARAARRHAALQSLNLSGNPIGDAGLAEISRLVTVSGQLAELVLIDTVITIRGALGLAEAMASNHSLTFASLPYALGFAILDEIQRILMRNYAASMNLDEQVHLAAAAQSRKDYATTRRKQQWEPVQPCAEPRESRTVATASTLTDWVDATQRPTLMYLSLLDKKAAIVTREEELRARVQRSPRGRGIAGLTQSTKGTVVAPRTFSPRTSDASRSSDKFMSLPPLPTVHTGFTSSFQPQSKKKLM
jgi:hypothetical protein